MFAIKGARLLGAILNGATLGGADSEPDFGAAERLPETFTI